MKTPFLRTPYNYDRDAASDESGLACPEPTMAQQQFRDEADINTILERFGRTGELVAPIRLPQYGDFTEVTDYHTALNAVIAAQDAFMDLPAKIRSRFDNDPGRFVDFISDDSNREEAIAMGLVEPSKPVEQAPAAPTASE